MQKIRPVIGHGKGQRVDMANCFNPTIPYSKFRGEFLPHLYQPDVIQFVTLRLADSLPTSKLEELTELQQVLLSGNHLFNIYALDDYIHRIERWLNQSHGCCMLQYDDISKVVEDALNFYDGIRYDLYDYVIMPNHLHFLILPYEHPVKIMSTFKSYTAKKIRRLTGYTDRVWQEDFFDRMIRSVIDFYDYVEYIKQNTEKCSWL